MSGLFTPQTVRPMDISSHVWTFCPTGDSPHGRFPHTRHFAPMGDSPIKVSHMNMGRNIHRRFTSKTWRWKVRWSNCGLSIRLASCPRPSSSAAARISMAHLCDSADIMDIIRNCFQHVELTVSSLLYFDETDHGYDLEIYVRPKLCWALVL